MTTQPSPFKPYPKTRGPAKIFLFGDAGTLKTRRAMAMPKPLAIIDMEGGACDYQDLAGPEDLYLSTRSVAELERAIAWVEANPGKIGTLIVDPITVVWQQLQQGHIARTLKRGWIRFDSAKVPVTEPEEVTFQVADWNKLTTHHNAIVTRLLNLPCHTVAIARGMEKTDEKGNSKGYGWDGQKSLEFLFKIVIETRTKGDVVRKDRFTNQFKDGTKLDRVDLGVFVKAAGTSGVKLECEDEAARRDGGDEDEQPEAPHDPSWEEDRKAFCTGLVKLHDGDGFTYDEVKAYCAAKNWPKPSTLTRERRNNLVKHLSSDKGRADILGFLNATSRRDQPAANK